MDGNGDDSTGSAKDGSTPRLYQCRDCGFIDEIGLRHDCSVTISMSICKANAQATEELRREGLVK